jgi:hypothetical protein
MSAPLNLTAAQIRNLADALDAMGAITAEFGVDLTAHGRLQIGLDGSVVAVSWDADTKAYVIDDRNGD